ncbi:MAG TPA: hypothetical protein VMW56_13495 [Candidatus Margulisiibacteriota bacterium]|nr:hypothetical protein [Candidatus Margulisiibacteriota bacterium]
MRVRWGRTTLACVAAIGGLLARPEGVHAVSINIGSASGTAGGQVQVPVTLSTTGEEVAGVANDIVFDPAAAIVECIINPAFAGLSGAVLLPDGCTPGVDCRRSRVLIIQFPPLPIDDGSVLYICTIAIAADAPMKSYPLTCSAPSVSDPNGKPLPVQCADGQVQTGFSVCDVASSAGDNTGAFGDGSIDIFDVRAIFNASQLGVDVPATGTARFSAMDASAVDTPPVCGGDGTLDIFDVRQCFGVAQLGETDYGRTDPGPTCTSKIQPQ